jgi:hypothetical protein
MSQNDKRQAQRRYRNGVLEFYDEAGLLMTGHGRLVDLSLTGALVESVNKLEIGEILRFCLRLDGETPLDLMAKVVRGYGKASQLAYGLQFGSLSSAELSRLKSLI